MKPIARLVTRLSESSDGLILGVTLQGQSFFKPNTVYSVEEVMGELEIKEAGPQHPSINWGHDISTILSTWGKLLFLTDEEFQQQVEKGRP